MAHKKLLDPIHPGEILIEEFMGPMEISINQLARKIGVPPGRISAIVNGKRAITADTALRWPNTSARLPNFGWGFRVSTISGSPNARSDRKSRNVFSNLREFRRIPGLRVENWV